MAVITKLSHEDFESILSQYHIKDFEEAIPILAGVENTNYILKTTESKYILTIFEKRVSKQDIPFFLGLMDHLANKGFPVPNVITNINDGKTFSYNAKTGVILSFLEGKSIMDNISNEHAGEFGKLMGNVHNSCSDFSGTRKNDYNLHGCKKLFQELVTRRAIDQKQYHFIEEILSTDLHPIAGLGDELDKGIVHGDMFPDNVFFKEGKVSGLIDFYFASYDFLIYDLAIAINAWGFDNDIRFNKERSLVIINSYNSIRPLKNNDREYFKHFCLLAATRFYLTRLYDEFLGKTSDSHINLKNPNEFLTRVEFFKQWRGIKA
jgi:homoserine kinase type II